VVTVKPWPFEDDRFTVSVETMVLSQLSFKDDPALRAALQNAPIEELTWEFSR
jgi:hypothetical protein